MDGGPWWTAVHGVAKNQTGLNDFPFTFHFHLVRAKTKMGFACIVKNLPAMQETQVRFLSWEDPLEEETATHSSFLGLPLWLSW